MARTQGVKSLAMWLRAEQESCGTWMPGAFRHAASELGWLCLEVRGTCARREPELKPVEIGRNPFFTSVSFGRLLEVELRGRMGNRTEQSHPSTGMPGSL